MALTSSSGILTSQKCAVYSTMIGDNLPGVLASTTGILKENVEFLLRAVHYSFQDCTPVVPHGPANV